MSLTHTYTQVKRPDGSHYPYYGECVKQSSDCGQCFLDKTCFCNLTDHCCHPGKGPQPKPRFGDGCAGSFSENDFSWQGLPSPSGVSIFHGTMTARNDDGETPTVAIAVSNLPKQLQLTTAQPTAFFAAAIVASIGLPNHTNIITVAYKSTLHRTQAAPPEAPLFDVIGHCFNASTKVALPPAVGALPCKTLITKAWEAFAEAKASGKADGDVKEQDRSTDAFSQWTELSALLVEAISLMLSRASTELQ